MKRTLSALMVVASLSAALTPVETRAGNDCWAAVGGFLGGVILSSAVRTSYGPPPPTYYCPPPVIVHPVVIEEPVETGHYEYQDRQVWVAGSWVYEQTRCGDLIRAWRPGYYQDVQVKVWVPGCAPRHYARRGSCEW